MNTKKIILKTLLLLTSMIMLSSNTFATGTCKNVQIKISNQSNESVKLVGIDYKNPASGEWNNQLKLQKSLQASTVWQYSADIAAVVHEQTQIRIVYQSSNGKIQHATSSAFICKNNQTQTIMLP